MSNPAVEKVTGAIPDAFYDFVTYIIPASYLLLGILFICDKAQSISNTMVVLTKIAQLNLSWIVEVVLLLIAVSILYVVGQILSTIAHHLSLFVLTVYHWREEKGWLASRKAALERIDQVDKNALAFAQQYPQQAYLTSKMLAKTYGMHSIIYVSTFLLIIGVFVGDGWLSRTVFFSIFALSYLDTMTRWKRLTRILG